MAASYCIPLLILCLIHTVLTQGDHIEQRMIDETGEIIPYKHGLSDGEYCINSVECSSGCCVRSKKSRRKCGAKSLKGDKCNNNVVKGQLYWDHCPCKSGENACVKGKSGVSICSS
ncbi:U-scoloptoxin(18)-Er1a-like [Centruroides vittatus]|uniref:U-scoloptoxin(18)-Er1a-like n=1 Tax=Centruroides vittatus TaxID=120091 RepID=UPI00350F81E6